MLTWKATAGRRQVEQSRKNSLSRPDINARKPNLLLQIGRVIGKKGQVETLAKGSREPTNQKQLPPQPESRCKTLKAWLIRREKPEAKSDPDFKIGLKPVRYGKIL